MDTDPIIQEFLQQNQQTKWTAKKLDSSTFNALQTSGHLGPGQTSASLFDVTTNITISNKPHSTHKKTPGNSYISYYLHSRKYTGSITIIVRLPHLPQPLLVVHSLLALTDQDKQKSPYTSMPGLLNASVVYNFHGGYHVIECNKVVGQLVVVQNVGGTFGIHPPTLSIVECTNIVSFQKILLITIYSPFSIFFRALCKTTTKMKMPCSWKKCRKRMFEMDFSKFHCTL